jgi:CMP-N-acetylneuraminic acid synthetase
MKIVSMLPARGGSKGIPKKNLALLNGKPLIHYTIYASKYSNVDETWVSTDCPDIEKYALEERVKVLKRPAHLATDTATTESVLLHFAEQVEFDAVILIQPTSPMITRSDINRGIELFKSQEYSSVISVVDGDDILIWDKKWHHPMNYDPYNRGRRQERTNTFVIETGGFYIVSKEDLLKTRCRITNNVGYCFIPFWRGFEVDTMEDLIMISKLMA